MKLDFVNGVTHDLKSPLAGLRAGLDLLQGEAEKAETGRADPKVLADVLFAGRGSLERLTHMITSLLEVAHIEQGMKLEKAPTPLDDVASCAVQSFALIGLELGLVVESALTPIPMVSAKMERAVANLASNAIKYTARGRVRVYVADKSDRFELRVEDTGPGIPSDAQKHLFSKFFRVKDGREKMEGTGLGLAVVKGIVEAHGGVVRAESAPGNARVDPFRCTHARPKRV